MIVAMILERKDPNLSLSRTEAGGVAGREWGEGGWLQLLLRNWSWGMG
jgi:hypothetical protein